MASQAVNAVIAKAQSVQATLARYRRESKLNTQQALEGGCQLLGGAAGGFLDGRVGGGETHELWGVPTALGAGLLVGLAGLSGAIPGAIYVANLGLGAAAYGLGNLVKEKSIPAA
jgi:hypothetical protein